MYLLLFLLYAGCNPFYAQSLIKKLADLLPHSSLNPIFDHNMEVWRFLFYVKRE